MAHAIKKTPAVLMALLLAGLLALTMGLSLQKVYAYGEISGASFQAANGSEDIYTDGDFVINVADDEGLDLYSEGWRFDEIDLYLYDYRTEKETALPQSCYSTDGLSIIVDGEALKQFRYYDEEFEEYNYPYLFVLGSIICGEDQYDLDEAEFGIYDPYLDCHYDTDEIRLMPSQCTNLENSFMAHEYCTATPAGEEIECTITDVAIEGASDIIKLTELDYGWEVEALAVGETKLKVTYDGSSIENTYYIDVYVSPEIVEVLIGSKTHYNEALPGKSLTLTADAHHFLMDEEGEVTEGKIKSYKWYLGTGSSSYATITKNKKKPYQATLKFKSKNKDAEVIVWCEVTAKTRDGETIKAMDYGFFYRSTDFYQISPATVDADLQIGKSTTITPKLRHYTVKKPKGVVVNDVTYKWEFINEEDKDCIEVSPESGAGPLTIKRLNGVPAYVELNAYDAEAFEAGEPAYYCDQPYYFNDVCVDLEDYYVVLEADSAQFPISTHVYGVDDVYGMIEAEDMKIRVYDEDGQFVPENMYDLTFARFSDYNSRKYPVYEEDPIVDSLFGIEDEDQDAGFTAYYVYASGNDYMSYGNSEYAAFVVQDEMCLNGFGAKMLFGDRTLYGVNPPDGSYINPDGIYSVAYGTMSAPPIQAPDGVSLTEGSDYTISYFNLEDESNPVLLDEMPSDLGLYGVQVKGKDPYRGESYIQEFEIDPLGTQITKLSKGKKSFKVKWEKQTALMPDKKVSGYVITYGTDPDLLDGNYKQKFVKGADTASATIKKLKAKKKYYVQVSTYIDLGDFRLISDPSSIMTVKTK